MATNEEKAYVVVRADISPGYQIVQTAHAVAEHEAMFPGTMSGKTMVVLQVPNSLLLRLLYEYIAKQRDTEITIFFEPDIDEYTAFAVSPSIHHGLFQGLQLAGS